MKDNLLNGLSPVAQESLKEWAGVATNLPGDFDYLLDKTSGDRVEYLRKSIQDVGDMDSRMLLELMNFYEAATQLMQEHVIVLTQEIENRWKE